jgi:cation:H+ antiporter
MLSTLVIPILAILLMVYASLGKRTAVFRLNYQHVKGDLSFFVVAYSVALACVFVTSPLVHIIVAVGLMCLYLYYVKLKFSESDEEGDEGGLEPLFFARKAVIPSFGLIGLQGVLGLAGLALGAHLFVLLVAPLATELPEMSNSFLWLYRRKDRLAVGNVTGAMVFQGTIPVSIGLLGTDWALTPTALISMVFAVAATTFLLVQTVWGALWRPWLLSGSAVLYIGYVVYLYGW